MKVQIRNVLFLFSFLFVAQVSFAQNLQLPLNYFHNTTNYNFIENNDDLVHTSSKPLIEKQLTQLFNRDLAYPDINHNLSINGHPDKSLFARKVFYENLIIIKDSGFYITIDPLMNFEFGQDGEDTSASSLYTNTRGILVRGNVGSNFSFSTSFYESQSFFPDYLSSYVASSKVVPGQGRTKPFKKTGYDYAMAQGYLSYSPKDYVNIIAGHGKNFIGDGYRSLLLSDAGFNYPHLKSTWWFFKNKLQYTTIFAQLNNLNRLPTFSRVEPLFERKGASFFYLNYHINNFISVGLFEGTIWQTMDTSGTLGLNPLQLNPVIGVNTVANGFSSENNTVSGVNLKVKTPFHITFYSQLMIDEPTKTQGIVRGGYQLGLKYTAFKNLLLQLEWNDVAPFSYTNELPLQSFTHYNQPLAHPQGAGFTEIVFLTGYRFKRLFANAKINYYEYSGFGHDVFLPSFKVPTQSKDVELMIADVNLGFMINPKTNLNVSLGVNYRNQDIQVETFKTNYVYFALRTSLSNLYYDF